MVRNVFDFVPDEKTRENIQNVAFGIGILFGAMSVVIALLGIWAAVCPTKNRC